MTTHCEALSHALAARRGDLLILQGIEIAANREK